ncbi:MAG: hypothetical protein IPG96_04275 [Proteobacteria bacterium]|nr:hypothetical protein [Pseudomonadota bacterium]
MPTKTSSSSSDARARRARGLTSWAIITATALALGATACGSSGGDGPCLPEAPPELDGFADDVLRVAQVQLETRRVYDADGKLTETALVAFTSLDLSTGATSSRLPAPCCGVASCFLLTGEPTPRCPADSGGPCGNATCQADREVCVAGACVPCQSTPLPVEAVTLDGLAAGALQLSALDATQARWGKTDASPPLFGAGPLTVQMTGASATDALPSYTQSIEPPAPLTLLQPDPAASVALGDTDLPLRWTPGNGDWVEARLRGATSASRDAVVCIGRDDGCLTIPVGAIETISLNLQPSDKLKLSLRRVRSRTTALTTAQGSPAATQLRATTMIELQLAQ